MFHKFITYLRSVFFREKSKLLVVSVTGDTETIDKKKLDQGIAEQLRNKDSVSHEVLQSAALVFFNVDIPTSLWRLQYAGDSIMYFRITGVRSDFMEDELTAIHVTLVDDSLGTSLKLNIEVRDFPEVLKPVVLDASFYQQSA